MTTASSHDFASMSKIQKWQYFMRKQYQKVERNYYPAIDELTQKLADLGEIDPKHIPDFTLYLFSFIKEWQYGDVNTLFVLDLLKNLDMKIVAEKTITRRLQNFMQGKERSCPQSCDYIDAVIRYLTVQTVPMYQKYLECLVKFFQEMHKIDQSQVRLSWIEQVFKDNGEVTIQACEISLNQMFREIDCAIIPKNSHKYTVGDNVIVFDEDSGNADTICHWIFGPKSYIKLLREQFKVTESMSLVDEKDYLRKLIGVYVQ